MNDAASFFLKMKAAIKYDRLSQLKKNKSAM